ncbi:unnamed protein product, partial [Laminaria digitata]
SGASRECLQKGSEKQIALRNRFYSLDESHFCFCQLLLAPALVHRRECVCWSRERQPRHRTGASYLLSFSAAYSSGQSTRRRAHGTSTSRRVLLWGWRIEQPGSAAAAAGGAAAGVDT